MRVSNFSYPVGIVEAQSEETGLSWSWALHKSAPFSSSNNPLSIIVGGTSSKIVSIFRLPRMAAVSTCRGGATILRPLVGLAPSHPAHGFAYIPFAPTMIDVEVAMQATALIESGFWSSR